MDSHPNSKDVEMVKKVTSDREREHPRGRTQDADVCTSYSDSGSINSKPKPEKEAELEVEVNMETYTDNNVSAENDESENMENIIVRTRTNQLQRRVNNEETVNSTRASSSNLSSINERREELLLQMNTVVQNAQDEFESKLQSLDELEAKMVALVNAACDNTRSSLFITRDRFFEQLTANIEEFENRNASCVQLLESLHVIQSELSQTLPRIGLPL